MSDMNSKIQAAESAVRVLRGGIKQPAGHKSAAVQHAAAVRAHVASARAAVDEIREFTPYDWRAKDLVTEAGRLMSDADQILADLDTRGAYRGPLRSGMSAQEKADFVGKHGQEKYLALPW
jgi:hypothetical protein